MGEINLSSSEMDAIASIDSGDLRKRVELAVRNESAGDLHLLPLDSCGPYVSAKLSAFRQALADHSRARAPRKRADTSEELQRAGLRLTHAVGQMQSRMELEKKEEQLFHIDDDIMYPSVLSERLSVRVTYRWRKTIDDKWAYSSIIFTHVVDTHLDFRIPVPKSKPSAAKRNQVLQEKRYQAWEELMRSALYSVRDFFRNGGDGGAIPDSFPAVVDQFGFLNNHSTRFWSKLPDA